MSKILLDLGHSPTSLVVLGKVLSEARTLVARSPEQVAGVTGLSGRTIRRLEDGLIRRPHTTTLEGLAEFYALDPDLLHQLVAWCDLDGEALLNVLRKLDESQSTDDLGAVQLAMRAARRGFEGGSRTGRTGPENSELVALIEDFLALDRRRRTHARFLLRDLRVASEQERAKR